MVIIIFVIQYIQIYLLQTFICMFEGIYLTSTPHLPFCDAPSNLCSEQLTFTYVLAGSNTAYTIHGGWQHNDIYLQQGEIFWKNKYIYIYELKIP